MSVYDMVVPYPPPVDAMFAGGSRDSRVQKARRASVALRGKRDWSAVTWADQATPDRSCQRSWVKARCPGDPQQIRGVAMSNSFLSPNSRRLDAGNNEPR